MTIIAFLSLSFLIVFCFYDYKNVVKYISSLFSYRMRYMKYANKYISFNKKRKREKLKTKKGHKNLNHLMATKKKDPKKSIIKKRNNQKVILINKKKAIIRKVIKNKLLLKK